MPQQSAPLKRSFKLKDLERREIGTNELGRKVARFAGWLAVFGNRDWYDSMLQAGCFSKSLSEREWFPLLADHDANRPMGRFKAEERDKGLWIEAEVFLDISYAMDKWLALEGGAVDGLSVGFSIVKREYDEEKELLTVLEARLWEGSVVTFPANELARVEALRSMQPDVRKAVVAMTRSMTMAEGELADEVGRALGETKDPVAVKRVLGLLDTMTEQIEALRSAMDAAALEDVAEPALRHSADEISSEDLAELTRLTRTITQS